MRPETASDRVLSPEARIAVPAHVVYRSFPTETVVLNLETGKYHGLNPTAGRMIEAVERAGSVRAAAPQIAEEFEQPQAAVERDMHDLCQMLLERRLIEIERRNGR